MPRKRSNKSGDDNDTDVSAARGRLMGALQGIAKGSDEESEESEYDEAYDNEDNYVNYAQQRKKREGATDCTHTYIMKLYDRSVDLTMYTEETPLYPICRAWMTNQPKLKAKTRISQVEKPKPVEPKIIKREKFTSLDMSAEGEIKDVLALPAPEGALINRIPPKMEIYAKENIEEINLDYDSDEAPPKEELLKNHLKRWLKVRNHWQEHAAEYEKRYKYSAHILNTIYNKAQETMDM
ncbi:protein lin-37 homolog [Ctenocephalides felis]|uniref:protein lin-37 homolog n=1 Tax=Ctenocephalides felis TaxID=7515 RepID=UPI000E6E5782|nr:protein lin-37 homolog [Ctenocephalides felis]XP_026481935.1 protein lin-37 homolog [Ctenocephalides felis]